MSHYKPYPKYKDSGVEWIGKVPEHWDVVALKRLGTLKGGCGFPPDMQGRRGHELPFYKVGDLGKSTDGVTLGDTEHSISRAEAASLGATIFQSGALAWAKIGAALSLNKRRILMSPSCLDNNMTGFTPDLSKASTAYCFHLMVSVDFSIHAKPGAVPSFSEGDQGELRVACPPSDEQDSIAKALDRETSRIDALIAKKTRFIELLKEKRQALITHAVTKGLNPKVKMKDSGVDWLGDIPEYWEFVPSNSLFRESKERAWAEDEHLSATQKYGVIPLAEYERLEERQVTHAVKNIDQRKHAEVGDFVISMRSFEGGIERVKARGCVRSSYVVLKASNKAHIGFYTYLFKSSAYIQGLQATATFIRDGQDLSYSNFRQVKLPCPSLAEQKSIADFLEKSVSRIDALTEKNQRSIDLLKERRSAFITAAVTGQIDLREEV